MSEQKKRIKQTAAGHKSTDVQSTFYGGLKSKNELYFQMASLFREATKGSQSLSDQWVNRIMATRDSNTSGKFF